MSSTLRPETRGGRLLAYAGALAFGAYVAARTAPKAPPAEQPWSVRGSSIAAHPSTRSARQDTALHAASPTAQPALAGVPDLSTLAPHDAFGEAYKRGLVMTGTTPHRIVLFTFDDGPDPRNTPLLLDRLDEAGVKAVFFLVASRIAATTPIEREQAAVAREIARRGHLIGGHTFDHVQLPLLTDEQVESQLARSDDIFERVLGGRPRLFRPPFGAHSQRIDQLVSLRNNTVVLWNLGTGDFLVRSADEVYQIWLKVFERRERENGDRGGIVLLHDTQAWSVDAFQMIMSHLMARNCEFVARGEELFDIVDDPRFFFVPRGDAVAEIEAPPALLSPEVLEQRQAVLRSITRQRCQSLASN